MRQHDTHVRPDEAADFVLRKLAGVLVQLHILSCRGRRLRQDVSASGSVLNIRINGMWIMTSHILTSESAMVETKGTKRPDVLSRWCHPSGSDTFSK